MNKIAIMIGIVVVLVFIIVAMYLMSMSKSVESSPAITAAEGLEKTYTWRDDSTDEELLANTEVGKKFMKNHKYWGHRRPQGGGGPLVSGKDEMYEGPTSDNTTSLLGFKNLYDAARYCEWRNEKEAGSCSGVMTNGFASRYHAMTPIRSTGGVSIELNNNTQQYPAIWIDDRGLDVILDDGCGYSSDGNPLNPEECLTRYEQNDKLEQELE
jgi:hypothetical protein